MTRDVSKVPPPYCGKTGQILKLKQKVELSVQRGNQEPLYVAIRSLDLFKP